jgi:glutamine amidotransferase
MGKRIISVIDYGAGNIASVINMIKHVGGEAEIISEPSALPHAEKLLLPGVGAFDHGMQCLKNGGWLDQLNKAVFERAVPILGICLGMQLMCRSSQEGQEPGLGWIEAKVLRFNLEGEIAALKVPHMGWNVVTLWHKNALISDEQNEQRFYFVHSFYVQCERERDIFLKCNYGNEFVAGFHHENIWGVQFHPEKSHKFGMEMFSRFLEV